MIVAGCVIRGETSHYDIVCNMTNHWLMETAIKHCIPLGNAVLTVDTEAQALRARAVARPARAATQPAPASGCSARPAISVSPGHDAPP